MLRGCQRRVIVLKDTGNPHFEEAYVVLKDRDASSFSPGAMVEEAQKMLREGENEPCRRKHLRWRESICFLAGMAFFAVLSLMALLIFQP